MKQILSRTLLLLVVIAAILGLSSCKIFIEPEPSTYDLIINKFERNVVFGSELDLSGLDIEVTTGTDVKHIIVTKDMISGGRTDAVGEQELIIEYSGYTWNLYYEVFYKVEHIVDGLVYDSQLVTSKDELMKVKNPSKQGYTFIGWDVDIPEVLTGNLRIEAMFADVVIPEFSATYGDTLADLTLPEAKEGRWEWKHDLNTPVGNAGINKFTLVYTPNNTAAEKLEFQVEVKVAKKKVDITIIKDKFEYDGNEHAVEYQLSDGLTATQVGLLCFGTEYAADCGSYYYNLRIFGENYEGQASGYLEITKPVWNVSVLLQDPADSQYKSEISIDYGTSFPSYKVVIVDQNGNPVDVEALGFKAVVNVPDMLVALGYEISATIVDATDDGVDNLKNYDISYTKARFVVNKVDFNPGEPVFVDSHTVYYGDLLSSIKFSEHPNGEWAWDYEYAGGDTVGNHGKNTFKAVFTPKDPNYNSHVAYVVIDVEKQILDFVVDSASTVVNYDGKEHCLSYVVVDKNGNVMEGLTVTGNTSYSTVNKDENGNAISWPIELKIVDANYTHSTSNKFELFIKRIDPETDFETPRTIVWRPELKLGNVSLPEITVPGSKYEWISDPSTAINAAGTYTFRARFTPADTDNYNVIEGDMTVIVSLASTTIGGIESSYDEWTYDGKDKSLAQLFSGLKATGTNPDGSPRDVAYYIGGEKVEKLVDAGVYNVRIAVSATEQYDGEFIDVVVIINRANAEITGLGIAGTDHSWTYLEYDEENDLPYSTINYGTVIYEYKLRSADDSAYTTVVPTEAGEYVLRARVEGGEGYNWNAAAPKYCEFTIKQAIVDVPTILSKPYTGGTLVADVDPHDLYEVKENGNVGGINVGKYPVVLTLDDAKNYVWSNGDIGETSLDFYVTQAENSIDVFDGGKWVYTDTITHTGINAAFGKETVTIKYYKDLGNGVKGNEVTVVTDAGDYIVRAEIMDTPNYKGAYREVSFTVEKLEIKIPDLEKTVYEYTGSDIDPQVMDSETEYYSINQVESIGVNTYYVNLDLKNVNYKWEDGDENIRKPLEYKIVKSLVKVESAEIEGWTFGQAANDPSATKDKTFGVFKYEYKLSTADDSTYTTTVPTAAGDYVLRVGIVDNVNYDFVPKTTPFTIDKAEASIQGVREDRIYTTDYNTRAYNISGVKSSHLESVVGYSIKNESGETVTEMKNAGTYYVTFTLDSSANYYAAESIDVTVIINKFKVNTPELDSISRVYDGTAFEPKVKANAHAAQFSYSYPTEEHKNAGSYAVQFTINEPANYEWRDEAFTGSIPYSITKADASISIVTDDNPYLVKNDDGTYTLTLTYSGAEFDISSLIGATRVGESNVAYSVSKVTNVSDSCRVTVSVDDSTNYNGTTELVNVVINPANIANATINLGSALTYTGAEQTQSISSVKLGELNVTYTVSGTTDKATVAGNHTVTVIGTGNFTGTKSATFTIAKKSIEGAEVNLGTLLTYTGVKQTQTVSSVVLEGYDNVTFDVSGNEATYAVDANGNTITYKLKVTGNGNFTGTVTKEFTVARRSIAGATVNLGAALTYTGAEQYQTVSSVMLGDLAATYAVSGNAATYVVNDLGEVRTYTLKVTGNGNFTGEETATFTVAPKSIAGATVNLTEALTYTGREQTQTVSVSLAGFSGITYTVSGNKATYAVDDLGNLRSYTLTVFGTGNFTGRVEKSFGIAKFELDKPDIEHVLWTGINVNAGITSINGIKPTDGVYDLVDEGGIDEGDYEATITIINPNYKWKGINDATVVVKYAIAKQINKWQTEPTISKNLWTYNDLVATVDKGAAEQGEVTYKFAPEGTTDYTDVMPDKPGKYFVVFTATAEGYRDLSKTFTFEIKKDTLITPEFEDNTLKYANNSIPALTLKANADADKFSFTNNVESTVGDYYIVFTIKSDYVDYYEWENEDDSTLSVPYYIIRADEEITNLEIEGWTYLEYSEKNNLPDADKRFDDSEIIYEYKHELEDDTKYTTTVPTLVGHYVLRARIVGGEGYNWNGAVATKTFSITAADASISIETNENLVKNEDGTYTLTLTYTGEEFDLEDLIGATRVGEADVEYSTYKVTNVSDSRTVTVSVADSANYNGTSVDVIVVINPANIKNAEVTLGADLTYNGVEQYKTVASVTLGDLDVTYTVSNNAATSVVDAYGEVITYTLKVTGNGNFTGEKEVDFFVLPKSIANAEVTLGATLTYNGEDQNQTVASVTLQGYQSVTYKTSADSDLVVHDATDYSITVLGTGNFTGSVVKTFTVAPLAIDGAEVTLSLGNAPIYNGQSQTQSITSVTINGITLASGDYDESEDSVLTAKKVDDYTITLLGKGNFTGSVVKSWSIETLYLDMPVYDTTTVYIYDGVTKHVFFSETNTFWKAEGDLSGVNAGDYYVDIAIKSEHEGNCEWRENVSRTYKYTVQKGTNEFVGTLTMSGWTYEDTVIGKPTGITGAKFGFENIVYKYYDPNGDLMTSAPTSTSRIGTYTVYAHIPGDGNNYDDITTTYKVEFVISPKEIIAPKINPEQDYVKGGDNYPTILGTTDVLVAGDNGDYTVKYNFTAADELKTYSVTLTLNDSNYVWKDTKDNRAYPISYTLKGESAKIETEDADGIIDGWIFNNAPENIVVHVKNHLGITVSTSSGVVNDYVMSLLYFESNADSSATGSTTVPTSAGTYYFKIVIEKDEERYERTVGDKFYQFTIAPQPLVAPTMTVIPATFGQTLGDHSITDKVYFGEDEIPGTWTWVEVGSTSVGNVGNNTFKATFKPTSGNYATIENVDVTVAVSAMTLTVTNTSSITSKPYTVNGYKLSDIFTFQFYYGNVVKTLAASDYTVTITDKNGTAVDSFTTIGKYKVTVSLNNANYTWHSEAKTEFEFEVTKVSITLDGAVGTGSTAPYGGTYHGWTAESFKTGLTLKDANDDTVTGLEIGVIIYTDGSDVEGSTVSSITDAGTYYVKYYLVSESDIYAMADIIRTVVVTKAKVEISTVPTFTSEYFINQFNRGYYTATTAGKVTVAEGQFIGKTVEGSWSYSASFNSQDPTKSTLTSTFTLSDKSYKNYQFVTETKTDLKSCSDSTGTVNLLTVAVAGDSMTSGTKYGSLEDALGATDSGTVWLMSYDDKFSYPTFITEDNYANAIVLMSNATVKSGVTLVLPYNASGGRTSEGKAEKNGVYTSAIKNPETNRKTLLIIANGVELTVEGTLEVNGQLSAGGSGGDYSGQTYGEYAEILLDGTNTKITCNGVVKCSGYITGNGTVNMVKGTIYIPFILRDFGGGSLMASIKNNGMSSDNRCSPFTEWMFENVQCTLVINSGVVLNVWANLTADNELYDATGTMIGEGAFMYLPAGSQLITNYNPATEVLTVDIYGGATFNPFSLKILENDISTAEVFFPLNWSHDIRLHGDGAVYNASTLRFQLMYGCKLTIEEGAKLKIKELMVHDDYEAYLNALNEPSLSSGIAGIGNESRVLAYARTVLTYKDAKYHLNEKSLAHPRLQDAKLVVNGALEVESFGGKVYSEAKNASITITSTASCSVKLPVKFTLLSLASTVKSFQTITKKPTLYGYNVVDYVLDEDGQLVEWNGEYDLVYNEKTKKYEYQKPETLVYARFFDGTITDQFDVGIPISTLATFINVGKKWVYPTVTVKYDTQGGSTVGNTTHNHIGEGVFDGAFASGVSKDGYVFGGWYLDQSFTKPLSNYLVDGKLYCPDSDTVVLYAGWTYKIDYEYIDPYGNVITQSDWAEGEDAVVSGGSTAGTVTLFNPTHETYQFLGWFADEAGTIKVGIGGETISESVISKYMENNTVKLYGIWRGTVYTFTVNDVDKYGYGYTNNGYGGGQHSFMPSDIDGAKFPVPANTKENVGYQYYFTGWSVSVNGGSATTVTDIAYFEDLIPNLGESVNVTVTAQWAQKVTITVNVGKSEDSSTSSDTSAKYKVTFTFASGSTATKSHEGKATATNYYYLIPGEKFAFSDLGGKYSGIPTTTQTVKEGQSYNYTINWIDGTGSCITGDTLITLADGTQKRVDQLTGDELLLVWNLETGRYEASNIVFVDSEAEAVCEIIHLYFSNGSEVKVISEHGFFDLDLGKYVYIDATNYSDYIGHRFVTEGDINSNTWNEATLTNVVIEHKLEKAWSPVTFKQLCYYTNGVLSMPGGIEGLFNIFEVDTDTMTYDAEKMQADIETYGLFTYEDFDGIIPEIAFEAFNGAWLKVAIGKGMLTWEDIAYLAERYMPLI